MTMILLYLSRFKEEGRFATGIDIAWKGYLFDTLNELDDEDYIRQGSHRSKSVAITEEGIALARTLMEKYHIEDWK